jgi:hypothetical protein
MEIFILQSLDPWHAWSRRLGGLRPGLNTDAAGEISASAEN